MIRAALILPALAGLFSCAGDETLTGYGAAGTVWVLADLDTTAFPARATLIFPEEGKLEGRAPCNSYTGTQSVPYPWFKAEDVAMTRAACPELDQESRFFDALSDMSLAEVAGDTLILSNDSGRTMVFLAEH